MACSSNLNSFLSYVYVVTDVNHEGEISNPFRDEFRSKKFSTGNFGFLGGFSWCDMSRSVSNDTDEFLPNFSQ